MRKKTRRRRSFRDTRRRALLIISAAVGVAAALGGALYAAPNHPADSERADRNGPGEAAQATFDLKAERIIAKAKAEKATETEDADESKDGAAAGNHEEASGATETGDTEQSEAEKKEGAGQQAPTSSGEYDPPDPKSNDLWVTVPKLGRYDDYVANTDSNAALDQGAIKLPSTAFPWQDNGNTYIAAHVLGYPGTGSWQQFANLPNMTYGDKVYLGDSNGTTYTYEVSEIMVVGPTDTWVTAPKAGRDMVSLQTCINPPAYDKRLIVRADRVAVSRG